MYGKKYTKTDRKKYMSAHESEIHNLYKDKKKIIRTINEHNYKNRLLTNKITYASLNIILTEY